MADLKAQMGKITGPLTGVATTWAVEIGLQKGIFAFLAANGPTSAAALARAKGYDARYTHVVMRACYAAEVLDLDGDAYRLAEHMDTILLESDSAAYLAGAVKTFVALRETYLAMRDIVDTGETSWWPDFDPEWIAAVGENGQTYYRRMVDSVLPQFPDLEQRLRSGARYLDIACGTCRGPAKVVSAYPECAVTAVDCDAYSLDQARKLMDEAGYGPRFDYKQTMIEDMDIEGGHDLAIINISLHEAKDIERAVANVHKALDDGGTFLVSEFPFPENEQDCRSLPGKLMCGVQFFEAHIDCQLLPTSNFVNLLEGVGFKDVGAIDLTPMHVVIHGRK